MNSNNTIDMIKRPNNRPFNKFIILNHTPAINHNNAPNTIAPKIIVVQISAILSKLKITNNRIAIAIIHQIM